MDRKKVIIILAIVVIAAIVLFWFLSNRSVADISVLENTGSEITVDNLLVQQLEALPPPSDEVIQERDRYTLGLKQLAFSFAERYGSFSNQSNFKSLKDLKSLMTKKMQGYVDTVIIAGNADINIYKGNNTKALSSDLLEYNQKQNLAVVLVKTQRLRYQENSEPEVSYQNLLLKFIMDGKQWKVDEAKWQ